MTLTLNTETSQPLVVDTGDSVLVSPDIECVEAEENNCIHTLISSTCGCFCTVVNRVVNSSKLLST